MTEYSRSAINYQCFTLIIPSFSKEVGLQSSIDYDCCGCTLCWYHGITFLAQQALRMDSFTQDAAIWMSECTYKIEEGQVSVHYTLVLFERWRNFHSCQRLYSHMHQNQKLISKCIEFLAKLPKSRVGKWFTFPVLPSSKLPAGANASHCTHCNGGSWRGMKGSWQQTIDYEIWKRPCLSFGSFSGCQAFSARV